MHKNTFIEQEIIKAHVKMTLKTYIYIYELINISKVGDIRYTIFRTRFLHVLHLLSPN